MISRVVRCSAAFVVLAHGAAAQLPSPLLPFADKIMALQDTRRDLVTINPAVLARTVAGLAHEIDSMRTLIDPPAAGRGNAGRGGADGSTVSTDTNRPRPAPPKVNKT